MLGARLTDGGEKDVRLGAQLIFLVYAKADVLEEQAEGTEQGFRPRPVPEDEDPLSMDQIYAN